MVLVNNVFINYILYYNWYMTYVSKTCKNSPMKQILHQMSNLLVACYR